MAPVGNGKTRLAVSGLLPLWSRARVLILDVKGSYPELQVGVVRSDFPGRLIRERDDHGRRWYRVIVPKEVEEGRRVAYRCLARAYNERNWVVYCDEVVKLSRPRPEGYGLGAILDQFYLDGRYRPVTLIAGTQRPANVPQAVLDQPTHLYVGPLHDEYRASRGGEVLGDRHLRDELKRLQRFDWLYRYAPDNSYQTLRYGADHPGGA